MTRSATRTYDDFTGGGLDPARWSVLEVPGADGRPVRYEDRNARTRTGDGRFELTVDPFSRFHDSDPRRNNAKQMYRSVRSFAVPESGLLTFEVEMAVRTYGQIPHDLLDAFGTVALFDLDSGVVLNASATNDSVYALVERLPLPGVSGPDGHYTHRVLTQVPTEPGQPHRYTLTYRAGTREARWYVDGLLVYWARLPVPVTAFTAGMALFSARDLTRYSRAEREHGQGATGSWGPWRVTTDDRASGPHERLRTERLNG
ncbi:DUF6081 family protein [Streptomyces sp. NPDC058739]|uniref:DUF6081 family protein n=1 Tax=Streptomyces sp. NPDC058739 TaxID=3346618 RepID=UPI0036D0EE21